MPLSTGLRMYESNQRPIVVIEGIRTDVVALYEGIRAATEAEKARRGGLRVVDVE